MRTMGDEEIRQEQPTDLLPRLTKNNGCSVCDYGSVQSIDSVGRLWYRCEKFSFVTMGIDEKCAYNGDVVQ